MSRWDFPRGAHDNKASAFLSSCAEFLDSSMVSLDVRFTRCLFSCYKYLEFPCLIYEKCIICLGVISAVGENHVKIM
jgi:hypothetical protein